MQKQWSFHDAFGRLYVVGFYHSHDTGNFLLYINNHISIIDFNIKGNKDYSFILGNRLLQLRIMKASSGFNYDLQDNTPIPKLSKWEKYRDLALATLVIGMMSSGLIYVTLLIIGVLPVH